MSKNYTKIIVQRGEPMSDVQITQWLRVSDQTEWWRALIQLIDQFRMEFAASAPTNASQNNPLGMARDVGAYEALTDLMNELERRRGS